MYIYIHGSPAQLSPSKEKEGQAGLQIAECFGSPISGRNLRLGSNH